MVKLRSRQLILILAGILLFCVGIFYYIYSNYFKSSFGVLDESILLQIPADELPEGTLYITEERRYFQRGNMTLIIPSIGVYTPVGESTSDEGLKEMPGLYEFSQLPDVGDVNVSIAGHRDIYDEVFYSLDEVDEGDYAYLLYAGFVYRYRLVDLTVVPPTTWEVIEPQGFSCLTLTTCDPIGTSLRRLIARWELVDWEEYSEQYRFVADENAQL